MPKPMIRIYTDAENYIDREMNAEEYAQWQKDKQSSELELTQIAEKAAAAASAVAKLEAIGLTAEEIAALRG